MQSSKRSFEDHFRQCLETIKQSISKKDVKAISNLLTDIDDLFIKIKNDHEHHKVAIDLAVSFAIHCGNQRNIPIFDKKNNDYELTFLNIFGVLRKNFENLQLKTEKLKFERDIFDIHMCKVEGNIERACYLVEKNIDELTKSHQGALFAASFLEAGERYTVAQRCAESALSYRPDDQTILEMLKRIEALERSHKSHQLVTGRWPNQAFDFSEYEVMCRRSILIDNPLDQSLCSVESRVFALGSCFAQNMASELQNHHVHTYNFPFGEDVNSTALNLAVLQSAVDVYSGGEISNNNILRHLQLDKKLLLRFCEELRASSIMLFTLGVSYGFFDAENNPIVAPTILAAIRSRTPGLIYRQISCDENIKNINKIINIVRELNPKIKIVLTLSPVPIYRNFDRRSAVIADCLSKSTLRLAIDGVMRQGLPSIYYWPSFEIVKWASPHLPHSEQSLALFGSDDGHSRHVSIWAIKLNVKLFLEYAGFYDEKPTSSKLNAVAD